MAETPEKLLAYAKGYRAGQRGAEPDASDPIPWEIKKTLSVYCSCGAQWHQAYANPENLARHQRRFPGHSLVDHERFISAFTCKKPIAHFCVDGRHRRMKGRP